MFKNVQVLFLLLPAQLLAQSLHGELFEYDGYCSPYEYYRYPYEYRRTVRLAELPLEEKPVTLNPCKKPLPDDPLEARLAERMGIIIAATNCVNTNTVHFDMAPGLAPATR